MSKTTERDQIRSETVPNKRKRILQILTDVQKMQSGEDETVVDDTVLKNIQVQQLLCGGFAHLASTIKSTLVEINHEREKNLERRHKELMNLLTKNLSTHNSHEIVDDKVSDSESDDTCETSIAENTNDYLEVSGAVASTSRNHSSTQSTKCRSPLPTGLRLQKQQKQQYDYLEFIPVKKEIEHNLCIKTNSNGLTETNIDQAPTKKSNITQRTEYEVMKAKMLQMQRKKMEDRERKKLCHN